MSSSTQNVLGPKRIAPLTIDDYPTSDAELAWGAWQAARRATAAGAPIGWKLVPIEPTIAMICAMQGSTWPGDAYRAMLAAAPAAPKEKA